MLRRALRFSRAQRGAGASALRARRDPRADARAPGQVDAARRLRRVRLRQQRRPAARQKLEGWSDYAKCRPESSGLHEVYARFDDEDEYIGKAIEDPRYARGKIGTRVAGHPVILSVLFDRDGVVRGFRFVTDPRAPSHERRMAHMLRLAVFNRYDEDGWTCVDQPPAAGETPVGGIFIKLRCEKATPERHLMVESRFLRKPGQADNDPVTGEYKPGQFESSTRFEIFDPKFR